MKPRSVFQRLFSWGVASQYSVNLACHSANWSGWFSLMSLYCAHACLKLVFVAAWASDFGPVYWAVYW